MNSEIFVGRWRTRITMGAICLFSHLWYEVLLHSQVLLCEFECDLVKLELCLFY